MNTKCVLLMACALLLCGSAFAGDANEPVKDKAVTLWFSGSSPAYQNTNLSVMLGLKDKNAEAGVAVDWRMFSEGDTDADKQSNLAVGPYAVYHFPDVLDINNPIDVPWLPASLAGEPFLGLSYLVDTDGRGSSVNPFVGIRLLGLFVWTGKYSFFHGFEADDEFQLGLSLQWKF